MNSSGVKLIFSDAIDGWSNYISIVRSRKADRSVLHIKDLEFGNFVT